MKSFFATFGRLPNTWPILVVTILAGFGEGLGLTMFVPLLELMGDSSDTPSRLFSIVRDLFVVRGLSFSILPLLVVIVCLVVGGFALGYVQRRMLAKARHSCGRDLRAELFRRVLHAHWSHLSTRAHGEVLNDLTTEVNRASAALQMQLMAVAASVQAMILAIVSAALSWEMALVAFSLGTVIVLATRPLLRRSAILGREQTNANREFGFYSVDYLKGARLIKITGSVSSTLSLIKLLNERVYRAQRNSDYNSALIGFLLQAAPVFLMAIIIGVSHEVIGVELSYILVFLLLLARMAPRVAEIPMRFENYLGFVPGLRAVDEAIADAKAHEEKTHRDGKVFTTLRKGIRFEGVDFRYPESNGPVINGISLEIPRNQITAIVGSSGAGKSTLTDLIVGLRQPTSGRILIDDVDLAHMNLVSWRKRIGYVTQDIVTFNDTLRNNLLFIAPDASPDEINAALEMAHLTDFIAGLPDGLETPLGESGIRLSGGQKQRISLARALLGNPELLILDEATSELDAETERIIHDAIQSIANRLTVVIIAHRLSAVQNADQIHVVERGQIIETGTYDELLDKKGRFADLHHLQFQRKAVE